MDVGTIAFVFEGLTKGQQTKIRILDRSIRCLAEKGFEGSSLSELAFSADVTKALIAHYFKSKEGLIHEAILMAASSSRYFTSEFLRTRTDFEDPIERYIHARFEWAQHQRDHASLLGLAIQRATYDSPTRKLMSEVMQLGRRQLEELLIEGMEKGRYPKQDAAALASTLQSIVLGMTTAIFLSPETPESKSAALENVLHAVHKLIF
jgi:AcrR family transcriptional regulator